MGQNAATFFVDRHVECGRGGKRAVVNSSVQLTYGDLAKTVNQMGHNLLRAGVGPEQRVALLLHDCPEAICFFMAALKVGAVAVPINTFCNNDILAYYLNDTRAHVLVTHRAYREKAMHFAGKDLPFLRRILYVEDMEWKSESIALQPFSVEGDDSAFWVYTSGSGGPPKAVVHRHAGMMLCAENYGRHVLGICENDLVYSTSKLFFAYGLGNSVIFPFSVGASCVLHDGRNDADSILSLIHQSKPTFFFSVPTLYDQLLSSSKIGPETFASVKMCVSAGEYLSETIFDAWLACTGKIIYDGIGSTEAMHIFCSNRPGAYRRGTSGTPVEGYDLRIVNEHGQELGAGEIGCLQVRGKTLGKGYWNKYNGTQRVFLGEWLMTGDICQRMEDDYFRYIGRQDDTFKSLGLWVSPIEIEQMLLSHPNIKEAGVIGSKNPRGLVGAKAFVVPKKLLCEHEEAAFVHDIYVYLERRLSRYKIPGEIRILSCLPRTPTGKVARGELRHIYWCEGYKGFDRAGSTANLIGN